jgi:cryptochrome
MFIELRYPNIVKGPPSVTLDGQLLWREFFYCFSIHTPFFDCQKKNIHCLQINWRLLELPDLKNNDDQETQSQKQQQQQQALAMEHYTCWMEGRTGFPWIDAIMKQILQEGWAHHLARYAVASFLTRGGLYIAWKRGAEFMEENLIDLDEPLNIGNWLWISASCFSHDYTILYSPTKFPQAWDKTGTFIRKYLPALSKMPEKYIFEPWKAPLRIQRKSNCLIGKDYPFPIIDYQTAKKKCIDLLHLEYIKKQYGKVDYDH